MDDVGYTQIPNWLLSRLYRADDLKFREIRVLLYLVRKLHGFHKKSDKIPYSQLSEGTGIEIRDVKRIVSSLEKKGMITVRRKSKSINIISIKGSGQIDHQPSGQKTPKGSGRITHPQKKDQKSVLVGSPLVESNNKENKTYEELMMEITNDEEYE